MNLKLFLLLCVLLKKKIFSQNANFNFMSTDGLPWTTRTQLAPFLHNQKKVLPQCPDNFVDSGYFCYVLSKKSSFPPKCPFDNVLPFDSYQNIVVDPIWVPVHQNLTNGLGFLQWTEASGRYKTVFDDPFFYNGTIKGKDCLLYQNRTYEAVSCQEEHSGVCAYQKLNQWNNPLCGDLKTCRQSTLNPKSKCICLEESQNGTLHPKAELLEPYQNLVIGVLTNKTCAIGLQKTPNGTFVWYNSHKEVSYGFWSPDAVFDEGYRYGASTPSGWVLTEQPIPDCCLIEKELNEVFPSLNLSHTYESVAKLVLNVSSPVGLKRLDSAFLVYCFTDADLSLLYRYSKLTVVTSTDTYIVYQFEPLQYGPGHYWCESFKHTDSEPIQSNVIFFTENDFGDEFGLTLRIAYDEGTNPLSPDIIISVKNSLSNNSCPFRIMKITDVDEDKNQVLVDVKFTCLKNVHQAFTDTSNLALADGTPSPTFYPNYCFEIVENNLHWPPTSSDIEVYPQEYCFKPDGFRLTRKCIGDSTNGAYWSPITETCEIASESSITPLLLALVGVTDEASFNKTHDITLYYEEFYPLDVYLTANLVRSYLDNQVTNYWVGYVEIVDNILNLGTQVLTESQIKMCSIDNWKDLINIIENDSGDYDNINEGTNFAFLLAVTHVINGMLMQNIDGALTLSPILCAFNQKLDDILQTENLENAIWLDPSQALIDESAIFRFYFTEGFFPDESMVTSENIRKISGFISFQGPIRVIYRYDNEAFAKKVQCVYWNDDASKWTPDGEFRIYNNFFICEFWRTGDFAFLLTPPDSITESLSEILASNANSSEIMSRLYQESFRYDEFESFDIFLIGQILKKISTSNDNNLEFLSHVITNLQKVKKEILLESQMEESATDMILFYTDVIIQNQNLSDFQCITHNFLTLIYDLNNTDFSGFMLLDNNQIEILNSSFNTADLLERDDIDSALVLSPELKDQLGCNSKVIVNVFFKDVLFNEKKTNLKYKKISKVYDVILPVPEVLSYSGPIQIFHKMQTDDDACSYWFYNKSEHVDGFWKQDSDSEEFGSLARCDFNHTTHFALLILDSDKYDDDVLEWITNINCSLSVFGFFGIILTAFLFKSWRTKAGNKILLNFVFSGLLQIVIFYVSSNIEKDSSLCVVTGVVLHYAVLAQFCWMLVIALLQFRRFVVVFGTYSEHIVLKSCLFAWGVPFLPAICVVAANKNIYVSGTVGLCYPSGYGLYIGVWLPICVVILINLLLFIYVIKSVVNTKTECVSFGGNDALHQWRLIVFLFFMLGLTWVFAFLAEMDQGVVFVYLFCVLATLQGFVMFIFFIVLNKSVRDLYLQLHKKL